MYDSLKKICEVAETEKKPFYQVVLEEDCKERGIPKNVSLEQIEKIYTAMKEADDNYNPELVSKSKLSGKQGAKFQQYRIKNASLCGEFICTVIEKAIKMGESNACMQRIVAAPTAGSCGVVPAVLLSIQEKYQYSKEEMVRALLVSSGIGGVIAIRASLSGAAGGCQAEIGSAAAMAAGAAVFLQGGDSEQICQGAAMALKNLLGLACDPVGGLVEVPCVKRNVIGAMSAVSAADMALAGIRSKISPDEVIDAMKEIGDVMPSCIKETSQAGLALTPTGKKYQ